MKARAQTDRRKRQRSKRSVRGKSWRWQSHASLRSKVQATRRMPPKGVEPLFSFKITPRRPAGLVPRRAERSDRRRPPCAANGAAGPVRRQLGAKAKLFRQAAARRTLLERGGFCFTFLNLFKPRLCQAVWLRPRCGHGVAESVRGCRAARGHTPARRRMASCRVAGKKISRPRLLSRIKSRRGLLVYPE